MEIFELKLRSYQTFATQPSVFHGFMKCCKKSFFKKINSQGLPWSLRLDQMVCFAKNGIKILAQFKWFKHPKKFSLPFHTKISRKSGGSYYELRKLRYYNMRYYYNKRSK